MITHRERQRAVKLADMDGKTLTAAEYHRLPIPIDGKRLMHGQTSIVMKIPVRLTAQQVTLTIPLHILSIGAIPEKIAEGS